jgi:hypothetical protein
MDWDLSVNARPATQAPRDDLVVVPGQNRAAADLGPCLYLGPAGQRCADRATASGFCRRHQPEVKASGAPVETPLLSPRRIGAIFTILALLWPLLADIVRALIRYFR